MNSRIVVGIVGIIVLALPLACGAQTPTSPSLSGASDNASPTSQQSSSPQTSSDKIVPGRLARKEGPDYPKEARKQKLQGQVVLQVTIEEKGNVSSASVISGDPILGDAALKAVHKWKFEPFTQQGHAVSVQQNLVFDFVLGQKAAELESPLPEPKPVQATISSHPSITVPLTRAGSVTSPSSSPQVPSTTAPLKPGIYRVGGGVSAPRAVYFPDPEYSDEARRARYQGTCVLSLIVGPDGLPRDIKVTRSLGMGLDEKAIEAVKQWRFQPAMKDGGPVAVAINVEVMFRL